MSHPSAPATGQLLLVPGSVLVLFLVQLDSACPTLAVPPGRFLEGLRLACELLGFSSLERDEDRLDELLPWSGNV